MRQGFAKLHSYFARKQAFTIGNFALDTLKWFFQLQGREADELLAEFRTALSQADAKIFAEMTQRPELEGMGTTLTMAYSVGTDLFIVHAGDSRAYLFRAGELEQLSTDHTLVQALVEGGAISPEDAKRHPRRHVVTNVIGGPRPGVDAEIHKLVVRDGDVLLICTDGLTEPVDDPEIAEVLNHSQDPRDACRRLVDLDYYKAMGGFPYGRLAEDEDPRIFGPEVFSELSFRFTEFADLLSEISETSHLATPQSLLRLYERWLQTGSRRVASLLAERGITPVVPGDGRPQ